MIAMGRFDTTRWSVVLRARGDPATARAALETLCQTYRPPVLAFVRRRGYDADAAEDLTQTFFTKFLEGAWHGAADPARGRFRSFVLTALKRFLLKSNLQASSLKRGGAYRFESLDGADPIEPATDETPELVFERAWADAVLDAALGHLRGEAERAGKRELFERLREFLVEPPDEDDYARIATELGMRRNTLAVAVHRLRQRLRELVRNELAETVDDSESLDDELRFLRRALGDA